MAVRVKQFVVDEDLPFAGFALTQVGAIGLRHVPDVGEAVDTTIDFDGTWVTLDRLSAATALRAPAMTLTGLTPTFTATGLVGFRAAGGFRVTLDGINDIFRVTDEGDVYLSGNLIFDGSATIIDADNMAVADNVIVLNRNEAGAGISAGAAGIEIERGTLPNAILRFNESTDVWEVSADGGASYSTLAYTSAAGAYVHLAGTETVSGLKDFTPGFKVGGTTFVDGNRTVSNATWQGSAVGVAYGGTGATTAVNARAGLGLVIGLDVPGPGGAGASGTWGINISGNAATVTNGVYTNSFGQGLKTAADGTIVPDYAGTGSANNPARSDHTHANGVAIGGPYQPQGSYAAANHTHANDAGIGGPYQAEGNYAIQGHGHDVSEISGMPRLRAYGFLSTSPSLGNSWYAGAYSPELNDNGWTVRLSNSCPLNALILVTPRGGDDVVTSYTAIVRKEATGNTFEIETFANWPSSTGSTPMPVSCTFMVFYD